MRLLPAAALLLVLAVTPARAACDVALDTAGVNRFLSIAMGSEYGTETRFAKWVSDIRVVVRGRPTRSDRQTLSAVIAELNTLIAPIRIQQVETGGNVDMHFAPDATFPTILPGYVPGNMGFFSMWWNDRLEIGRATVLISSTGLTQHQRNHLIREEFTQMLGFAQDVGDDPESIFFEDWTEVQDYSASDRAIIRAGYCPDLQTMMSAAEVRHTLAAAAAPLTVHQLQQLQAALGYEEVGTLDARTRDMVANVQEQYGLPVTGIPTQRLFELLLTPSKPHQHTRLTRTGDPGR